MDKGSIGNLLIIKDNKNVLGVYVFKNWVARFNMEEEIRQYIKGSPESWSYEGIVEVVNNSKTKCWGLDSWENQPDIEELNTKEV